MRFNIILIPFSQYCKRFPTIHIQKNEYNQTGLMLRSCIVCGRFWVRISNQISIFLTEDVRGLLPSSKEIQEIVNRVTIVSFHIHSNSAFRSHANVRSYRPITDTTKSYR
jgi:hypothetical protein